MQSCRSHDRWKTCGPLPETSAGSRRGCPGSTRAGSKVTRAVLEVLGMEITERLLRRDEAAQLLEYSIVDSPLDADVASGQDRGPWAGRRQSGHLARRGDPDSIDGLLVGTYQQALDALKTHLEQ